MSMPPRGPSTVPLDALWDMLLSGIRKVYEHQEMTRPEYVQHYTSVYNYCTTVDNPDNKPPKRSTGKAPSFATDAKNTQTELAGGDLYKRVEQYLQQHLQKLRVASQSVREDEILRFYTTTWEDFKFSSKVLSGICTYLNRHWVQRKIHERIPDVYIIYELALVSWRNHLFSPLREKLTHAVLNLIERERNGEQIPSTLIKGVVDSYVALGLYVEDNKEQKQNLQIYKSAFVDPFLEATSRYYTRESAEFLAQNSLPEYMKKAELRLKEEKERVDRYLDQSTSTDLIRCVENELISKHLTQFHHEFATLLKEERKEDTARMHQLLSRVPNASNELKETLQKHIHTEGLHAIEALGEQANDPKMYVQALLDVHAKSHDLVCKAFTSEAGFVKAMDQACTRFINQNYVTRLANSSTKSPELLARYCDLLLRKSNKNIEERELEELLKHVMTVFKYLEDKDVFQKFYKNHLARRLVHDTSASDDAEESMISRLKEACGFEYIAKLQRMFQDKSTSRHLSDSFKKDPGSARLPLDFSIQVLTHGQWPLQQSPAMNVPSELQSCYDRFQQYYQKQHSGRKLTWMWGLSKCDLNVTAFKKKYIWTLSSLQSAVVLLFNDADEITFGRVCEATSIEREIVQQIVTGLLKFRVILPMEERAYSDQSLLRLNMDFVNAKHRINMTSGQIKSDTKTDTEATHKHVEDDRRHLIQAAIVRIMKMRKSLKHQELVTEVIQQLQSRFHPKVPLIKKQIESLIEKEYIARGPENSQNCTYSYLA